MPDHAYPLISAKRLQGFAEQVFIAAGCRPEEARSVAYHLVDANLTGHDPHGIGKLPEYVQAIGDGRARTGELGEIVIDSGSIIVLDGRRGMGQVLAARMMDLGIARAHQLGAAVTGLRNAHQSAASAPGPSNAPAPAALHALRQCHRPHALCGAVRRPRRPPRHQPLRSACRAPASRRWCSTSPPARWPGASCSSPNKGATGARRRRDRPAGKPTRDPTVMYKPPNGAILPFGEHKGAGLAVLCDLLAGALTAAAQQRAAAHDKHGDQQHAVDHHRSGGGRRHLGVPRRGRCGDRLGQGIATAPGGRRSADRRRAGTADPGDRTRTASRWTSPRLRRSTRWQAVLDNRKFPPSGKPTAHADVRLLRQMRAMLRL